MSNNNNQPRCDFYALSRRRQDAQRASKTHMVRSLNKDGSVTRMWPTKIDWRYNTFASAEKAEQRKLELERLNPGKRFVVVELM